MIRLSFIVPFYDVELYIEPCIQSLYNQDIPWEEYEVICIDDCSPDGSRAIVERLQKEFPTLRLICHSENKRQGGARNTGLRAAQGRYIWFVDSDDFISPNCLSSLLSLAEKEELDILDFDFDADLTRQHFIKNVESYEMGPCPAVEYVFSQRQGRWSWRCVCVWGGIIRKDLLRDMWFRENVQYEDNDFALLMYARAKRLHHIPLRPYYYRVVENSTVHKQISLIQVSYTIELIETYIKMRDELYLLDNRWQSGVEELIKYFTHQLLVQLNTISSYERNKFYRDRMGRIPSLRPCVGKKAWLALNHNIARALFVS